MRFKKIQTKTYLWLVVAGAITFSVSAFFALGSTISQAEKDVFDFVYGWDNAFKPFFWTITQLGSIWVLLSAILVFYWQQKKNLALKLLLGGLLTYTLTQIAKVLINRPRPYILFSEITRREDFVINLGYPSGHTALVTFFAIIIRPYLHKRWRWTVWLPVAGVAVSRIYLGVHAPLDVIGGFAIGLVVAYTIRYLLQRQFQHH